MHGHPLAGTPTAAGGEPSQTCRAAAFPREDVDGDEDVSEHLAGHVGPGERGLASCDAWNLEVQPPSAISKGNEPREASHASEGSGSDEPTLPALTGLPDVLSNKAGLQANADAAEVPDPKSQKQWRQPLHSTASWTAKYAAEVFNYPEAPPGGSSDMSNHAHQDDVCAGCHPQQRSDQSMSNEQLTGSPLEWPIGALQASSHVVLHGDEEQHFGKNPVEGLPLAQQTFGASSMPGLAAILSPSGGHVKKAAASHHLETDPWGTRNISRAPGSFLGLPMRTEPGTFLGVPVRRCKAASQPANSPSPSSAASPAQQQPIVSQSMGMHHVEVTEPAQLGMQAFCGVPKTANGDADGQPPHCMKQHAGMARSPAESPLVQEQQVIDLTDSPTKQTEPRKRQCSDQSGVERQDADGGWHQRLLFGSQSLSCQSMHHEMQKLSDTLETQQGSKPPLKPQRRMQEALPNSERSDHALFARSPTNTWKTGAAVCGHLHPQSAQLHPTSASNNQPHTAPSGFAEALATVQEQQHAEKAEYLPLDVAIQPEAECTPPIPHDANQSRDKAERLQSAHCLDQSMAEPLHKLGGPSHKPDGLPILVGTPIDNPLRPRSDFNKARGLRQEGSSIQGSGGLQWADHWAASATHNSAIISYENGSRGHASTSFGSPSPPSAQAASQARMIDFSKVRQFPYEHLKADGRQHEARTASQTDAAPRMLELSRVLQYPGQLHTAYGSHDRTSTTGMEPSGLSSEMLRCPDEPLTVRCRQSGAHSPGHHASAPQPSIQSTEMQVADQPQTTKGRHGQISPELQAPSESHALTPNRNVLCPSQLQTRSVCEADQQQQQKVTDDQSQPADEKNPDGTGLQCGLQPCQPGIYGSSAVQQRSPQLPPGNISGPSERGNRSGQGFGGVGLRWAQQDPQPAAYESPAGQQQADHPVPRPQSAIVQQQPPQQQPTRMIIDPYRLGNRQGLKHVELQQPLEDSQAPENTFSSGQLQPDQSPGPSQPQGRAVLSLTQGKSGVAPARMPERRTRRSAPKLRPASFRTPLAQKRAKAKVSAVIPGFHPDHGLDAAAAHARPLLDQGCDAAGKGHASSSATSNIQPWAQSDCKTANVTSGPACDVPIQHESKQGTSSIIPSALCDPDPGYTSAAAAAISGLSMPVMSRERGANEIAGMYNPTPARCCRSVAAPHLEYARHIAGGGPAEDFAAGIPQPSSQPTVAMAPTKPIVGALLLPLPMTPKTGVGTDELNSQAASRRCEGSQTLHCVRQVPADADQVAEQGTTAAGGCHSLSQNYQGPHAPANAPELDTGAAGHVSTPHVAQQHAAGLQSTQRIYSGHHHQGSVAMKPSIVKHWGPPNMRRHDQHGPTSNHSMLRSSRCSDVPGTPIQVAPVLDRPAEPCCSDLPFPGVTSNGSPHQEVFDPRRPLQAHIEFSTGVDVRLSSEEPSQNPALVHHLRSRRAVYTQGNDMSVSPASEPGCQQQPHQQSSATPPGLGQLHGINQPEQQMGRELRTGTRGSPHSGNTHLPEGFTDATAYDRAGDCHNGTALYTPLRPSQPAAAGRQGHAALLSHDPHSNCPAVQPSCQEMVGQSAEGQRVATGSQHVTDGHQQMLGSQPLDNPPTQSLVSSLSQQVHDILPSTLGPSLANTRAAIDTLPSQAPDRGLQALHLVSQGPYGNCAAVVLGLSAWQASLANSKPRGSPQPVHSHLAQQHGGCVQRLFTQEGRRSTATAGRTIVEHLGSPDADPLSVPEADHSQICPHGSLGHLLPGHIRAPVSSLPNPFAQPPAAPETAQEVIDTPIRASFGNQGLTLSASVMHTTQAPQPDALQAGHRSPAHSRLQGPRPADARPSAHRVAPGLPSTGMADGPSEAENGFRLQPGAAPAASAQQLGRTSSLAPAIVQLLQDRGCLAKGIDVTPAQQNVIAKGVLNLLARARGGMHPDEQISFGTPRESRHAQSGWSATATPSAHSELTAAVGGNLATAAVVSIPTPYPADQHQPSPWDQHQQSPLGSSDWVGESPFLSTTSNTVGQNATASERPIGPLPGSGNGQEQATGSLQPAGVCDDDGMLPEDFLPDGLPMEADGLHFDQDPLSQGAGQQQQQQREGAHEPMLDLLNGFDPPFPEPIPLALHSLQPSALKSNPNQPLQPSHAPLPGPSPEFPASNAAKLGCSIMADPAPVAQQQNFRFQSAAGPRDECTIASHHALGVQPTSSISPPGQARGRSRSAARSGGISPQRKRPAGAFEDCGVHLSKRARPWQPSNGGAESAAPGNKSRWASLKALADGTGGCMHLGHSDCQVNDTDTPQSPGITLFLDGHCAWWSRNQDGPSQNHGQLQYASSAVQAENKVVCSDALHGKAAPKGLSGFNRTPPMEVQLPHAGDSVTTGPGSQEAADQAPGNRVAAVGMQPLGRPTAGSEMVPGSYEHDQPLRSAGLGDEARAAPDTATSEPNLAGPQGPSTQAGQRFLSWQDVQQPGPIRRPAPAILFPGSELMRSATKPRRGRPPKQATPGLSSWPHDVSAKKGRYDDAEALPAVGEDRSYHGPALPGAATAPCRQQQSRACKAGIHYGEADALLAIAAAAIEPARPPQGRSCKDASPPLQPEDGGRSSGFLGHAQALHRSSIQLLSSDVKRGPGRPPKNRASCAAKTLATPPSIAADTWAGKAADAKHLLGFSDAAEGLAGVSYNAQGPATLELTAGMSQDTSQELHAHIGPGNDHNLDTPMLSAKSVWNVSKELRPLLSSGAPNAAPKKERRFAPCSNLLQSLDEPLHGSDAKLLSVISRCQTLLNALGRSQGRRSSRADTSGLGTHPAANSVPSAPTSQTDGEAPSVATAEPDESAALRQPAVPSAPASQRDDGEAPAPITASPDDADTLQQPAAIPASVARACQLRNGAATQAAPAETDTSAALQQPAATAAPATPALQQGAGAAPSRAPTEHVTSAAVQQLPASPGPPAPAPQPGDIGARSEAPAERVNFAALQQSAASFLPFGPASEPNDDGILKQSVPAGKSTPSACITRAWSLDGGCLRPQRCSSPTAGNSLGPQPRHHQARHGRDQTTTASGKRRAAPLPSAGQVKPQPATVAGLAWPMHHRMMNQKAAMRHEQHENNLNVLACGESSLAGSSISPRLQDDGPGAQLLPVEAPGPDLPSEHLHGLANAVEKAPRDIGSDLKAPCGPQDNSQGALGATPDLTPSGEERRAVADAGREARVGTSIPDRLRSTPKRKRSQSGVRQGLSPRLQTVNLEIAQDALDSDMEKPLRQLLDQQGAVHVNPVKAKQKQLAPVYQVAASPGQKPSVARLHGFSDEDEHAGPEQSAQRRPVCKGSSPSSHAPYRCLQDEVHQVHSDSDDVPLRQLLGHSGREQHSAVHQSAQSHLHKQCSGPCSRLPHRCQGHEASQTEALVAALASLGRSKASCAEIHQACQTIAYKLQGQKCSCGWHDSSVMKSLAGEGHAGVKKVAGLLRNSRRFMYTRQRHKDQRQPGLWSVADPHAGPLSEAAS
ncbi:hypothetical protein WJX74_006379 [Apatococcus lobatus]|uniref:Uncharacterized protein n=1 Tax=Apatococcus lobatus TaxID=904363 RepID=A0AAW1RDB0_9CHLO